MTILTPHFSLEELTVTGTGIENKPIYKHLQNIKATAENMERVRSVLQNKPITVNSCYRSSAVNRAVGGSATSAHLLGYAVDFTCASYGSISDIYQVLKSQKTIKYDQLIHEGTWIHISFDPRMRMQSWIK